METINLREYSCPFCGATDRDRLYALYLDDLLAKDYGSKGIQMVDFAPVRCLSAYIRSKLCHRPGLYRTADLFDPNVDDRVDLMDMRIYRDGQFDFFICSHILEHVADDRKALRELFRITKPGGSGIVMVPVALDLKELDEDPSVTDEAERWRRFGQNDHVRLYSKKGLLERTRQAGFSVAELGAAQFGAEKFDQLAILRGSVLYIATCPG
jgi:SAM-dependent methyltransferase